eukprot:1194951-Prorocentrum_minimum.AAC.2
MGHGGTMDTPHGPSQVTYRHSSCSPLGSPRLSFSQNETVKESVYDMLTCVLSAQHARDILLETVGNQNLRPRVPRLTTMLRTYTTEHGASFDVDAEYVARAAQLEKKLKTRYQERCDHICRLNLKRSCF